MGGSRPIRKFPVWRTLLTDGEARLIALVGTGGIGKTRLALDVGAALMSEFDSVVMVALEEVPSADLVVSSIASSLGVPESRANPCSTG